MSTSTPIKPSPEADATATPRKRQLLIGAVLALVLVAAVVAWALTRGSDETVPFKDPRATGVLTLCDADGHRVTSGSVKAAPFVARAVGVTPAEGSKAVLAQTGATLYAYQPREGLGAGEWSGQQLTADSSFSNASHPIAQATTKDGSLQDFITAFPATWDGLVHLRLYVASPADGIAASYSAVTVKVSGSTWKVVGKAGTASCTAGDATSSETKTLNYPPATH
ncbi:MAG: hypothetical protein ACJ72D_29580 [Marmoricola sp.]